MGRTGKALVMLLPHETPYVDFLRLRKAGLSHTQLSLCNSCQQCACIVSDFLATES